MIQLGFFVVASIVALFAFGEGPQQEYVNAGVLPYSRRSGEIRVLRQQLLAPPGEQQTTVRLASRLRCGR